MRKFTKKKDKTWSLKLVQTSIGRTELIAVDDDNGQEVGVLITFKKNGIVHTPQNLKSRLIDNNMDPYQHNNSFNENGSIKII